MKTSAEISLRLAFTVDASSFVRVFRNECAVFHEVNGNLQFWFSLSIQDTFLGRATHFQKKSAFMKMKRTLYVILLTLFVSPFKFPLVPTRSSL